VSAEIAELQVLLKERGKDQMALRNAASRLSSVNKQTAVLKTTQHKLEDDFVRVETDRGTGTHQHSHTLPMRACPKANPNFLTPFLLPVSQCRHHHHTCTQTDDIYNSFEESIRRVQQQSDFQNQALEQRLRAAEAGVDKTALQVEEIIRAAGLDTGEMTRLMASLNQMLSAKEDALQNVKFLVAKLKKTFNDALQTYIAKFKELGIPEEVSVMPCFAP